jgi:hypothetical protein
VTRSVLAEAVQELSYLKVDGAAFWESDVGVDFAVAQHFGVTSFPTLLLFRRADNSSRLLPGALQPAAIARLLREQLREESKGAPPAVASPAEAAHLVARAPGLVLFVLTEAGAATRRLPARITALMAGLHMALSRTNGAPAIEALEQPLTMSIADSRQVHPTLPLLSTWIPSECGH